MCLKRDIEYYSSNDSINELEASDLEWPLGNQSDQKLIVACNNCFYPITFEEHVIDEIRDEKNISFGIVIPIKKLFKKVGIYLNNPLEEWRTEVYCPNCGLVLSFLSPRRHKLTERNFAKVFHYINSGKQIVILWTHPLFRGSESEAKSCFDQVNEF